MDGSVVGPNPSGLCECGCGERTPVAKRTRFGHVRGEHMRFVPGHDPYRRPISADDYSVEDRGYDTPCWIWNGTLHKTGGYGMRYGGGRGGRYIYAHILADREANGPAPAGTVLHHRCEQKLCVRPDHLERTTNEDHQRMHRKFDDAFVAEIRRATGSTRQIARLYGISKSHVAYLRRP